MPDKAGLEKTADYVNYLLALGTGALVFSAELIKKDYTLTYVARIFIIASWVALAASVLLGIVAYMRIPVMLSEQNYDLEDKYMIRPGKGQQIAFLIAIPLLGAALGILLFNRPLQAAEPDKPPPISITTAPPLPAHHFTIVKNSKAVSARGGIHYHTFLLDESSGQVWELHCSKNTVEFRKIAVEGLPVTVEPQKK